MFKSMVTKRKIKICLIKLDMRLLTVRGLCDESPTVATRTVVPWYPFGATFLQVRYLGSEMSI